MIANAHGANLITLMCGACGTFNQQWTNQGFDADTNNRGGAYNRDAGHVYAPGAAEPNQLPGFRLFNQDAQHATFASVATLLVDAYDNLYARDESAGVPPANQFERVLLLVYASMMERCAYLNDSRVHRWDTPALAADHLGHCFAGMPGMAMAGNMALGQLVLESRVVEDLLREKVSVGHAYFRLRNETRNPGDAILREVVRLSAMIQHLWMKAGPVGLVNPGSFKPKLAHGLVTPELQGRLLTGNGNAFSTAAERKLAAIYSCVALPPAWVPGNGRRFRDAGIHANAALTFRQKRFLQSMPVWDHLTAGAAQRTRCEQRVRRNVLRVLRNLADTNTTMGPPMGGPFADFSAATTAATLDTLLNTMIATLNSGLNWIETSATDALFVAYTNTHVRANFSMQNQSQRVAQAVPWTHVYPDCAGGRGGNYAGSSFVPHDLANVADGRQLAKRWYMDWRLDKDLRVYGGLNLRVNERPLVSQFTFLPDAPEPNRHYGMNCVVWNAAVANRAVLTVDDKGRPHRSRLLLLQDIFLRVPDVTGKDVSHGGRAITAQTLLRHVQENANVIGGQAVLLARLANALTHPASLDLATPNAIWAAPLTSPNDSGQRVFTQNRPLRSPVLIECHIFGRVRIHADAWALVLEDGAAALGAANIAAVPAVKALVATIQGYAPLPYDLKAYRHVTPDLRPLGQKMLSLADGNFANQVNTKPRTG